jgi:hypothetical protein
VHLLSCQVYMSICLYVYYWYIAEALSY